MSAIPLLIKRKQEAFLGVSHVSFVVGRLAMPLTVSVSLLAIEGAQITF